MKTRLSCKSPGQREDGTGLILGLLFFLLLISIATGVAARTAVHVRSLQRSEDDLRALAIAEAGADVISQMNVSRLDRSFDRGRFLAVKQRDGDRLTILSRGAIRSAAGSDVMIAVRLTGKIANGRFNRETWETIPARGLPE